MKKVLIIASALMLCAVLVLAAGCTQPAPTPVATTVPTTVATTVAATTVATPVTTAASTTPGPVQTLQSVWAVNVEVRSNGEAINPQIIATFTGGKGQVVIPQIIIKVTRSDGVQEQATMVQPLTIGKAVSLPGTTSNNDRAEVWVQTPNGDLVKISDSYIPFRSYN